MSDYLARIAILIGADAGELRQELQRSERDTEQAAGRIEGRAKQLGAAVAGGLAAAAAALGAVVSSAIDRADEIQTAADKLSTSAGKLSELRFAAEQSGSSLGALEKGLLKLNSAAASAAAGNEKTQAQFKALGIEVTDSAGKVKDSQELFAEFADKVASIENPSQQSAVAMKLLGKSGAELVPLLAGGSRGLQELREQAKKTGAALTDDGARAADDFNDALDRARQSAAKIGVDLLNSAGPTIVGFAKTVESAAATVGAVFSAAADVVQIHAEGLTAVALGLSIALGTKLVIAGAAGAASMIGTALAARAIAIDMGIASAASLGLGASLLKLVGGPVGAFVLAVGAISGAVYYFRDSETDAESATNALRVATENLAAAQGSGIAQTIAAAAATRDKAKASLQAAIAATQELEAEERRLIAQRNNARGEGSLSIAQGNIARNDGALVVAQKQVQSLRQALADLDTEAAAAGKRQTEYAGEVKAAAASAQVDLEALLGSRKADAKASELQTDALTRLNSALAFSSEEIKEFNARVKEQKAFVDQLKSSLDPLLALAIQYRDNLVQLNEAQANYVVTAEESERIQAALGARYREAAEEIGRARNAVDELHASQVDDIRLAGLSEAERQKEFRALRAVEEARRAVSEAQRAGRAFSDDEIAQIERSSAALAEQAYEISERTRQLEQIGGAVADSFGELGVSILTDFDSIGEAFDNLGDSLGNIAKRVVGDMISEFFRLQIIKPLLGGLLGGVGLGGLGALLGGGAGAAGAGGIGAAAGGLFAGAGLLSGLGGLFGGGGGSAISSGAAAWNAGATGSGIGLGTVLGAAGGAFSTYSAYRSGDPLGGALGGAISGATVAGPLGAAIGAIVGGLAGLLGGPKDPDLRLGGLGVTRKPEQTFTTALGVSQVGVRGGIDEREFIKLVSDFDAAIAGVASSFGDGTEQVEAIRARLATWAIDLKGSAITAEAVLGSRFDAILSTFDADVVAFVGAAGTVEDRVQRLADAALIMAGVEAGFAETFGDLAGILTDNQIKGEALSDTYARVAGAFQLMDGVLDGLGLTTELAKNEFIRFAAGVVQALGGLDAAGAVIDRNLNAYLSPEELRQLKIRAAQARIDAEGAAAGITGNIDPAAFRDLLNQALAGAFDATKTAAILRYGAALADFNDLVGAGAAAAAAAVTDATPDIEAAGAASVARRDARRALGEALTGISEAIADFGRTDYQRARNAITENFSATVAELARLAEAAGRTDGPLEGLSGAIELMELQLEEAARNLKRNVLRSLIDLYPTTPLVIGSELDLFTRGMGRAIDRTAEWTAALAELERLDAATELARNLRDLFDDTGVGVLDGLTNLKAPIKDILGDLGVSFSQFTSPGSIAAFGRAAQLFGLTAEELAGLAGIDLSGLTTEQRQQIADASKPKPEKENPVVSKLDKVKESTDLVADEVAITGAALLQAQTETNRLLAAILARSGGVDLFAATGAAQ